MAMNYTDEEYHQMTIEELYEVEVKPNLFAVSRIFAEAHKQMNIAEYKAFTYALSHIDWTKPCPETFILDKKELACVLGINSDPDHLSQHLKRAIGQMPRHSFIEFDDKGKDFYVSGNFVRTLAMFRNVVRIKVEDEFFGLFGSLDGKTEVTKYITMWSGDIFKMKSERSVLFYELLRDNSDTRLTVNEGTVSIRKFKEIFDIPKEGKGSYMTADGHFKRTHFEQYVIDPICEELAKTDMIRLVIQSDGKYYEKKKQGNRITAYKFQWILSDPKPQAAQIEEKEETLAIEEAPERELWESALEDFAFSRVELEAIGARLRIVPQSAMFSNGAAYGSLDLDRYHFMDQRAKDLKVAERKTVIKDYCQYLIAMIGKFIPKAGE